MRGRRQQGNGWRRWLGAAALGAVCAGCSQPPPPAVPVTVQVQMLAGVECAAMARTAAYWNERYAATTGIRVAVAPLNRVGSFHKLEVQLAAGLATPDIVNPCSLQLARLAPYLEPLDEHLREDAVMTAPNGVRLSRGVLLDAALRTAALADGHMYMLPKDLMAVLLFYRKDLMPRPPDTWDEYLAMAMRFTRSLSPASPTRYGTVMPGKYEIGTFCAALEVLWPHGADLATPERWRNGFGAAGAGRGFKLFEELAAAGAFPPEAVDAEYPQVARIIQNGDVAMALQWSTFYQDLLDPRRAPKVYSKIDIAPPPGVRQPDGSVRRDLYVQTTGLALNRRSTHKEEALRFLAWAALGEGALVYAMGTPTAPGGASPVQAVWGNRASLPPYPRIRPWIESFGHVVPATPRTPAMLTMGSSWVQRLMTGQATAAEAAAGLNREIAAARAEE